jgi:hypothetical protein
MIAKIQKNIIAMLLPAIDSFVRGSFGGPCG